MKIISIHKNQKSLIKRSEKNNREAQRELFDQFSPKMLGICRQYVKDLHHAEDLMLQGFLKVFTHLKNFKNDGSFEGWIRKIMVNICLSYLRKKNVEFATDDAYIFETRTVENFENTSVEDIQKLIDKLPDGYKIVFNLFAIEGYKHSEIAKELGITESTSKSQLFKARKMLQENYNTLNLSTNEKNILR